MGKNIERFIELSIAIYTYTYFFFNAYLTYSADPRWPRLLLIFYTTRNIRVNLIPHSSFYLEWFVVKREKINLK